MSLLVGHGFLQTRYSLKTIMNEPELIRASTYILAYSLCTHFDFCVRLLLRYLSIKIMSAPAVTALPNVRLVVNLLNVGAILSRSACVWVATSWCNGQTVARCITQHEQA